MNTENDLLEPVPPKAGEARKLLIISLTLMVTLPTLIGITAFQLNKLTKKTETESLESAIRSVNTQQRAIQISTLILKEKIHFGRT